MGSLLLLTLIMMSSLSQQQECGTLKTEMTLFASIGETLEWDMRQAFFTGSDLDYSLSKFESTQFQVRQSIEQLSASTRHVEAISLIRNVKPSRQYQNGVWLNSFIFLEQDTTSVDIFYATAYPNQADQTPNFNGVLRVQQGVDNFNCYDLDFITPTVFLADCSQHTETEGLKNGFIIKDVANPNYENIIANENIKGYKVADARKIVIHQFPLSTGETDQQGLEANYRILLIRGEPSYATENADITKTPPQLDYDCEIEVFKISGIVPEAKASLVLDKATLAGFVKADPTTFKFALMDFSVEPNGDIYILDAYNGIYVLTINNGMEWVFKDWITTPFVAMAYAFDFNYLLKNDGTYQKHLIVVYEKQMNTYLNGVQQNGYTLPFTAVIGYTQVQMSQNFVVLRFKKTIYLYSSETNLLINTDPMDEADLVLINPYEPDLIGLSQYSAHRYLISNGFLRWLPQAGKTDTLDSINVIATTKTQKQCQVNLKWRILDKNDSSLYDLNSQPFPSVVTYPSKPFQIDLMMSGPNLKYNAITKATPSESIVITVKSVWDLKLNDIQLPNAKDVIFSDILATDNSQQFYLLLQIPNKVVYIYQCNHNQLNNEQADCKQQDTFVLQVKLSKRDHSFTWWTNYGQILYLFRETDYVISIYSSSKGQSSLVDQIVYSDKDVANKITSFTILNNAIYVVQEARQEVDVYSSTFPIQQTFTINAAVMAAQGFTTNFSPKRVFGNKKLRSQLVFIQTTDKVVLGDYAKTFTLLKTFDIVPGTEVEIAIGTTSFFIVMKNGATQAIDQYNYVHLQKIYKTQTLPLFGYTLQEPLTADYSAQSGWLFVRAQDPKATQTVILVYEPNVLSHISLHKVLETQELIKENSVFDMAVDGGSQMFLYFNDNQTHKVLAILQDAVMQFSPSTDSPSYVNEITGGVQVSNFEGNAKKDIIRTMKVLNTQSTLIVKQAVFNNGNKVFVFKQEPTTQTVDMGNDWYHGQATEMYINCDQCHDHVTLQAPVYPITNGDELKNFDISDANTFGDKYLIYQARDSLAFTTLDGKFVKKIDLKQWMKATQSCELVVASSDQKYTFSTVLDVKNYNILVTQCTDTTCTQFLQGQVTLDNVKKISRIHLLNNKYVIILNTDPENFKSFEGTINIYEFMNDGTAFKLANPRTISTHTFGSLTTIYPGDFDVVEYQVGGATYYKVLMTDVENGLGFVDAYADGTGTFQTPLHEQFNLRTFSHEQFYVAIDTKFHAIKIIQQSVEGNTLSVRVLVTTSNVGQYILLFKFDTTNPLSGCKLDKKSVSLLYVLTPYGSWTAMDKIAYVDGYVTIPYTDTTSVTLGVYQIPKDTANGQTIPFIYGVSTDYHMALPIDFALLMTKEGDKAYLWANVVYSDVAEEHLVMKYAIEQTPKLVIIQGDKLSEQDVKLHIENAFGNSQGTTKLSLTGKKPDDDGGKSSSSNWWWITLIVVVGVVAVGVGGFFLYKKYGRNNVDPLLG